MENFKGDEKAPLNSPTAKFEQKLISFLLPKVPYWIKGRHLTMISIPLSLGMIVVGYLAQDNYNWLWLSSILIALHWFTDSLDGAVGKLRKEGVPRWGFFMDHFLDYVFMTCMIISYTFLFSGTSKDLLFFLIPISTGFMINSFLLFGATQKFEITYYGVGPTELRIFSIFLNTAIIYFGVAFIESSLIYVIGFLSIALTITVFKTQKEIRKVDDQFPE